MYPCPSTLRPPDSHFFFFNDTATTEIYTLSLHDALPISFAAGLSTRSRRLHSRCGPPNWFGKSKPDRKSTRLNSSHQIISYAVFCLKKKKRNRRKEPNHDLPHLPSSHTPPHFPHTLPPHT